MRTRLYHSGFTLIELSIVLVIIGILISASLKLVGPISQIVRLRETKESQDSTIQSIISWASSHNSLPNKDEFPKMAKSPNDPWGQPYAFLYYSSLSRSAPTKDTICGRKTTPLMIYTNYTSTNVAFGVISRADNPGLTFKSTLNGGSITASAAAPAGMIDASGTNADIVRWVTLDELRSKIGCQGAPLKILNNDLPSGKTDEKYSSKIVADGGNGSGSYTWLVSGDAPPPLSGIVITSSPVFLNISGRPTASRDYSFSVEVRDNIGNSSSKSFVLTVR